jgi:hypothetical protein
LIEAAEQPVGHERDLLVDVDVVLCTNKVEQVGGKPASATCSQRFATAVAVEHNATTC